MGEGKKAIYSQHGFAIYPLAIKATGAIPVKSKAKNWGHDLDLMSDLVDENTKIGLPETTLGLIPAGGGISRISEAASRSL